MKTILVSGISGFIGLHTAMEGIRRGYTVRGTIRNAAKAGEVEAFFRKLNPEAVPELFICDLLKPAGWDDAVQGCSGILHVASPFPIELPRHPDDVILPAVKGVQHVLESARRMGVRRIVQTSSVAAIIFGHVGGKTRFTDDDWTNPDGKNVSPYYKSKVLAERAFYEFGERYPEMQLSSICPGFVLGPLLSRDAGTSVEVLVRMMKGQYPGMPRLGFPCVDVRDVAALHWDCLEKEISIGKRYSAVCESLWFREIAALLRKVAPEFRSKVSARELPDWFVRIFSLFDKPSRIILPELGFLAEISGRAGEELGFRPRGMEESIRDSVESVLQLELVKKNRG